MHLVSQIWNSTFATINKSEASKSIHGYSRGSSAVKISNVYLPLTSSTGELSIMQHILINCWALQKCDRQRFLLRTVRWWFSGLKTRFCELNVGTEAIKSHCTSKSSHPSTLPRNSQPQLECGKKSRAKVGDESHDSWILIPDLFLFYDEPVYWRMFIVPCSISMLAFLWKPSIRTCISHLLHFIH